MSLEDQRRPRPNRSADTDTLRHGPVRSPGMRSFLALVVFAISGCSTSIPLALAPDATARVTILGSPSRECVIKPSDDAHRELQNWFAENQRGWSQLYYTPPSGGILLTAPGVRLHLSGSAAYAAVSEGMLTKQVSETDYAFLICKPGA